MRQQPEARRTPHPMQSLAVVGRYAADLAGRDTPSAFDPGSAFERMLELDFKLLLLGADIQAVSMLHYSEQRADVPYRYWKDFTGQVRHAAMAGRRAPTACLCATWSSIRSLTLDPVQRRPGGARAMAQRRRSTTGRSPAAAWQISWLRPTSCLAQDPWSLVTNRRPDQTE